jgi:hypothetical protein
MGNVFATCCEPKPSERPKLVKRYGGDPSHLFLLASNGRTNDLRSYLDNEVYMQGHTAARGRIYDPSCGRLNFIEQAVCLAARNGHTETCKVLLNEYVGHGDMTLIHEALENAVLGGHLETVAFLMTKDDVGRIKGAARDINKGGYDVVYVRNKCAIQELIDIARDSGHKEVEDLLIEWGNTELPEYRTTWYY